MNEPLRKCRICGLEAWTEKELEYFSKFKESKYGRDTLCKKCKNQLCKKSEDKIKLKALQKLSRDGFPRCLVCGFSDDIRFLQIDHIKNDGNKDLTSGGKRYKGKDIYRKILNMPIEEARSKYQVLCAFHNWAKRFGKTGAEYKVIVLESPEGDD